MRVEKLDDMFKGWFIGNFMPTVYQTNNLEVGVKKYTAGDSEKAHYHKVATEITLIISGQVKMNDKLFGEGDIVIIEPFEPTDFHALTDVITTVVKIPGANDDKYLVVKEG